MAIRDSAPSAPTGGVNYGPDPMVAPTIITANVSGLDGRTSPGGEGPAAQAQHDSIAVTGSVQVNSIGQRDARRP